MTKEATMEAMATKEQTAELLERVVVGGDLSKLTPTDRMRYYAAVCQSVGLNPITQPFQYLYLQNKMTLYARKEATEQLRELRSVSVTRLEHTLQEGLYIVTAYGRTKAGRTDAAIGAVAIENLRGLDRANAVMKAETKAKRRLTLSLCGLGMLDESEVDVPEGARVETEVVMLPKQQVSSRCSSFCDLPLDHEGEHGIAVKETVTTPMLFPDPEADRAGLIQRVRVAGARLNKKMVHDLKAQWLGGAEVEYEKADLSALVALVTALEGEKL